jgi:hypothetical protein
MDPIRVVLDHAVYLSEADEAEILRRASETADVGELALRTCQCGAQIDGFDMYTDHLHEVFSRST